MYVTKDGVIQKINEDTFPYWQELGWAIDEDRDGVADSIGGGGDTSGLVPIGSAAATVATADNPAEAETTMQVLTLPANTAVAFAIQIEGDDFPRYIFYADPENGIKFSDGTYDAWTDGAEIKLSSRSLRLQSQDEIALQATSGITLLSPVEQWGDIKFPAQTDGPVLKDRTLDDLYRVVLDNGVLSVELDTS